MKTLIVICGAVLAVAGFALIAGLLLPKTTEAKRTVMIHQPVDRVFSAVADVGRQSEWRTDIGKVELAEDGRSLVEHTRAGDRIVFQLEDSRPNELFAISYVAARGFSGEWVGRFTASSEGTRLDVTERVTIPNPLVRLVGRIIAPPGSHTDLYLADLQKAMTAPRAP